MPLNMFFFRPNNWSRLNPIAKAPLPPLRVSAALLRGLSSDPYFLGREGPSAFSAFSRIGFESLISKIRPTGFIMTGLR